MIRGRAVASYRFQPETWIAFGTEADETEVDDESVFGSNLEAAGQKNRALFAEFHKSSGKWAVDAGIRHDDNNEYGGQTSPRVGVQYSIFKGGRVWVSYGEGFRAPSVGELFFPGSGNAELEPETSQSTEIGFETLGQKWLVGVTGFNKDLTNLIDFDFIEFRNFNVGRAQARGVELKAEYQTGPWQLRWNGTYLKTEDRDTGLRLLRRPEMSSNLVASYIAKRWTANVTGQYVGRRDDVDPLTFDRAESSSYTRFDLGGEWRVTRTVAPYARIENVTDREYAEALGFPAPGLTIVGGVALRYR